MDNPSVTDFFKEMRDLENNSFAIWKIYERETIERMNKDHVIVNIKEANQKLYYAIEQAKKKDK